MKEEKEDEKKRVRRSGVRASTHAAAAAYVAIGWHSAEGGERDGGAEVSLS